MPLWLTLAIGATPGCMALIGACIAFGVMKQRVDTVVTTAGKVEASVLAIGAHAAGLDERTISIQSAVETMGGQLNILLSHALNQEVIAMPLRSPRRRVHGV
jgi:hypothetical protein